MTRATEEQLLDATVVANRILGGLFLSLGFIFQIVARKKYRSKRQD
jgi:hypothetical protein